MPKPFDQKLFDDNDEIAKRAVSEYLKKNFDSIVFFGDQYVIDILIVNPNKTVVMIEVEKRSNWVDKFPFDTVHVPYRKRKYFIDSQFPAYLFSVRSDCQKALYCDGETIINSPVKTVSNKYLNDEPFFDVSIDKWTLVNLC